MWAGRRRRGAPGRAAFEAVVEVYGGVADYLFCLMAFAGHKHYVAGFGGGYGFGNGGGAVGLHHHAGAAVAAYARCHVGDDVVGVLVPWIVGCEHSHVGFLAYRARHERALAGVAVAAGAEHAPYGGVAGSDVGNGIQHVSKGVGVCAKSTMAVTPSALWNCSKRPATGVRALSAVSTFSRGQPISREVPYTAARFEALNSPAKRVSTGVPPNSTSMPSMRSSTMRALKSAVVRTEYVKCRAGQFCSITRRCGRRH